MSKHNKTEYSHTPHTTTHTRTPTRAWKLLPSGTVASLCLLCPCPPTTAPPSQYTTLLHARATLHTPPPPCTFCASHPRTRLARCALHGHLSPPSPAASQGSNATRLPSSLTCCNYPVAATRCDKDILPSTPDSPQTCPPSASYSQMEEIPNFHFG